MPEPNHNTDGNAQNVPAMMPDLRQLYQELRDDFDWLRRKWSTFQELFGNDNPGRIELLNTVAPNFFHIYMRQSFEDTMLHLCRLTDPPKARSRNGDRESLTVLAISNMLSDPALKAAVLAKTKKAQVKCAFARTWRNLRLAHTDLGCLRGELASTLPEVKSAGIEDALMSLGALLAVIEDHFRLPHYLIAHDPWGAKSLVHYLERGRCAIDDEYQRLLQLASEASASVV